MAVNAPDSSKDMELYEACVSSVFRVYVKGAEEVQKGFTSLATSTWSWGRYVLMRTTSRSSMRCMGFCAGKGMTTILAVQHHEGVELQGIFYVV